MANRTITIRTSPVSNSSVATDTDSMRIGGRSALPVTMGRTMAGKPRMSKKRAQEILNDPWHHAIAKGRARAVLFALPAAPCPVTFLPDLGSTVGYRCTRPLGHEGSHTSIIRWRSAGHLDQRMTCDAICETDDDVEHSCVQLPGHDTAFESTDHECDCGVTWP